MVQFSAETIGSGVNRLNQILEKGMVSTTEALEEIQSEFQKRKDIIVRPEAMDFDITNGNIYPIVQDDRYELTGHSRGQLLARAAVPQTFAERLIDLDERDLLRENLRRLLVKTSSDGILVRHVGSLAKGILSSSYRRMDASPIFEGFLQAALNAGFRPYRGINTDTRYALTMVLPEIRYISPNEPVLFVIQIMTSDYGKGALAFNLGAIRFVCVNLMTGNDILRKVHLGRRFDNDSWDGNTVVELSNKTHQLDTRTVRSAITDAVNSSDRYIKALETSLQDAAEKKIDVSTSLAQLKKQGFSKDTLDKIRNTYEADLPVEALPQEPGAWRFSNVLSLLAKSAKGDEKLELERAAMGVVAT